MNLRDQLLKAGLASKKDAARAEHEVRKQAKVEQGNREAKKVLEARAAEQAERERQEREAELIRRRREANARLEAEMRLVQARRILRAHALRFRSGPQRFWFRAFERPELWRLCLPERIAEDLRRGLLGIAWVDDAHAEAVVVPRDALARVDAVRPELVLFWNRDGGVPDPAEQLLPY